mmetsp:Transcript_18031/g.44549  ORF Transcript_18031/g.44549 Transcript_18031/m.44549 type:complete len:308 (+) Transcript_18031:162-1085(+)|eukprot:CAMPEP_0113648934 /NCGR_PEP_ID=MMETSP0017_2-20120614/25984_1 /TAXON_ID=2856 /ORGANISM="Cylindrotheca closterium" /LENGTH=307 /DNA_ID=CAMNT_0000561241 /DNA_START=78 /DNA_END=1001 /DNA_ORIENTATION=+ /assembly_acc=CAM_ASM_000147
MTEQKLQQQQEGSGDTEEEKALRKSLATLDVQKKSMELEADAVVSELTTSPAEGVEPMGIDTPLVDNEGYPRGDIDVYRARTLRQRFYILKTDHKAISQKIDAMLRHLATLKNPQLKKQQEDEKAARTGTKPKPKFDPITGKWVVMNWDGSVAGVPGGEKRDFHNLSKQVSQLTEDSYMAQGSTSRNSSALDLSAIVPAPAPASSLEVPFARVNAVAEHSPAEAAGLLEDDLILKFAHVNNDNYNHLKAIAALVPDVAGKQGSISISVQRRKPDSAPDDWETVVLSLKPQPWSGRGLIGCHIVPYSR